jgi:5-methylcytosine-specific restriction protein A
MARNRPAAPEVLAAVDRAAAEVTELIGLLSQQSGPSAETIAAVEYVGRLIDAARIRAAAPLVSDPRATEELGFANPVATLAALAQVSDQTARARIVVAGATSPDLSISGAPLPPPRTAVAAALDDGKIGLDAAALITRQLDSVAPRVAPETLSVAETVMVNLASGLDPVGEHEVPPASVTYLATEIHQITATIDPDGALPREHRAARRRALRIGAQDEDGLVPLSGRVLPEVGALLSALMEAWRRSPRFVDVGFASSDGDPANIDELARNADARTPDQRRHDAFAEILTAAAAASETPQLNGAPVTVLVSVEAADLENEDGLAGDPIGTMAGSKVPVSRAQVERFIDANGYRVITRNPKGAVVGISSPQRCFTPGQRFGIAARDGCRCSTPGCTSPHYALQVHHVIPDRDGGPTTIDNGILLCYDCHRRVDDGPWEYRMVDGLPEVRGPGIPEWTRLRPAVARAA